MKNQILFESNEIQAYMLANSHSEIRPKCGLIRARKVLFFVLFCSCQENLPTLDNQSGLYDKVFYFLLLIFFSQSLKLIQKVLNLWVLIKNKSKMINPKIHRQQVPMYTVCKTVNLWTFRSDLHETSPYIIHTSSKKQVMRILKLSVEVVIMI